MSHSPTIDQIEYGQLSPRLWLQRWRERRRQKTRFRKSRAALARMNKLMRVYPTAYMDESWLSSSKQEVKAYLTNMILATRDEKVRRRFKNSWLMLSNFQQGVGEEPIDCCFASNSSPDDIADLLENYANVSRLAKAEMQRSLEDIEELVAPRRKYALRLVG